jgi:hypothetical protein
MLLNKAIELVAWMMVVLPLRRLKYMVVVGKCKEKIVSRSVSVVRCETYHRSIGYSGMVRTGYKNLRVYQLAVENHE